MAVRGLGQATDREVMGVLGFGDMNAVRPRLTELVHEGWLEECGKAVDAVTERHVRVLRVVVAEVRAERAEAAATELQREWAL